MQHHTPLPLHPVVAAVLLVMGASAACAQDGPASAPVASPAASSAGNDGITLRPAPSLQPLPRNEGANQLPIVLRADKVTGSLEQEATAEGNAEFRRGGMVIRADRLLYNSPTDTAKATGNVRINRDGNTYSGPELQLEVQRFEGFFNNPTYQFAKTGAGGTAKRIDFIGQQRSVALGATYTSCPADGSGDPAWLLSTSRISFDFESNEGVAENAVLRFYGVPLIALPRVSFPLNDTRKSGWLPPTVNIDSKSGFGVEVPYYWNIAPNRDATLTPLVTTRRGVGIGAEFRYLESNFSGVSNLNWLPDDRVAGRSRYALNLNHEGTVQSIDFTAKVLRVSDDNYWKDFSSNVDSITPRLLATDLRAGRVIGDWTTYARVQRWQVMQDTDPTSRIDAPYERSPQIGARTLQRFGGGFEVAFEGEVNRFTNPEGTVDRDRVTGTRVHSLGSLSRPYLTPGWSFVPKVSFNAATYELEQPLGIGPRSASRVIPSLSVDSAWVLERDANLFGKAYRQTLEPRLYYLNTPFRDQSRLPNFDSAAKDFNLESVYTDNAFSGIDRVSDANQLTAGVTTRLLDPATGAEALRLGVAQRFLFADQRITPDGAPYTQRLSDLLLFGSTSLVKNWTFDSSVQYNSDIKRTVRSLIGAKYSPGPFRTVSGTYRLTRDQSEQVELGWQWPLYGPTPDERGLGSRSSSSSGGCQGSWYSVGRVNFSTRDSRITDSIIGAEYDAGCWIGRVVAERLSTGRSEATTRLMFQLELVGLSRVGASPIRVLKDNIPGYRLLREERAAPDPMSSYD
ncbi:MAG: LPS-assembly protein LptD [Rhizobacter sp.]|nr:LPS-assembly protein LptD [Rhizobacter sp.]